MTRTRRAWELNDLYVRIVRHMLATNDEAALVETGTGTPEDAALMVRCYELAAMELWDLTALLEVAVVTGPDSGFTRAGESPDRIERKIAIAMESKSIPNLVTPPEGVRLLYRLGVLVYDELEETIAKFAALGRYESNTPVIEKRDRSGPARVKLVVASFVHPIKVWTPGWYLEAHGPGAAERLAPAVDNWAAHRTSLWTVGWRRCPS